MEQLIFEEDDNTLIARIPLKLFCKEAILNCFYWKTEALKFAISEVSDRVICVSIDITNFSQDRITTLKSEISNDLIDYELREIVSRETKNVKELIIAKAFSNGFLDDL